MRIPGIGKELNNKCVGFVKENTIIHVIFYAEVNLEMNTVKWL